MKLGAAGQAGAGDGAPWHHGSSQPGESLAADGIDGGGPRGFLERPRSHLQAVARQHNRRSERAEKIELALLAAQRRHLIAARGKALDRNRADAAGRAGDDRRTVCGSGAVPFQLDDRQRRGEAGGPNRHRVQSAQSRRQRHHPGRAHPHHLRVSAVVVRPQVVAGNEHRIAGPELRVAARGDTAGHVDPADERETPHDLAGARRRQRVFVVHARIRGLDDHFPGGQLVERRLDDLAVDAAVLFGHSKRAKGVRHGHGFFARTFLKISTTST